MRRNTWGLGDRQRKRQSDRELASIRIYRPLHLSNLHRLQAIKTPGSQSASLSTSRLPAFASDHNGIIYNIASRTLNATINGSRSFQLC